MTKHYVCVNEHSVQIGDTIPVGHVTVLGEDEAFVRPEFWLQCDKYGWVTPGTVAPESVAQDLRVVFDMQRNTWRPVAKSQAYCNPAGTPGAKVDLSRLDALPWPQEAEPATRTVAGADLLPPPFDSQEEAQRAAGLWPAPHAASYRVCVKAHDTHVGNTVPVGHVVTLEPHELLQQPSCWLPCDKDGWVDCSIDAVAGAEHFEYRGSRDHGKSPTDWRPVPQPSADAIPKPSALDEMAEQVRRWAVPTRSRDQDHELPTRECATPDYTGPFRYEAVEFGTVGDTRPALAVQEGGSHYKSMKIQPVEYIHANGLGYFEGNVVKYVSRWRSKGGLQDLKKARHYLDLLIELEGGTK